MRIKRGTEIQWFGFRNVPNADWCKEGWPAARDGRVPSELEMEVLKQDEIEVGTMDSWLQSFFCTCIC